MTTESNKDENEKTVSGHLKRGVIKAVLQWYRWQSAWAQLVDAIIGVITFGHIRTSLALTAAKIGAKKRHEHGKAL